MNRKVTRGTILLYCLPEFAVGLFTTMIANYLLYFYQPSVESGLPTLITQGIVVLGLLTVIGFIKSIGHVIDATVDPFIASLSDRSKNPKGRRIPFMRKAAIPFGLSALLIFMAPNPEPSTLNNIWVAVFIWAYFVFYSFYKIPYQALLPEMITDPKERVNAYTYNSLLFVGGCAVGYVTPLFVSGLKNAGLAPISAWRTVFTIFTVVGIFLLMLPTFILKETDFVQSVRPSVSVWGALKHAFGNKHFCLVTVAQLLEGTGMSFFQTCIMYYVTSLMGLPETASVPILALSIGGSFAMYPLVNKWAKRGGKKLPMILACAVFTFAEFFIFFCGEIPGSQNFHMVLACIFALFVSFPFAVLNILPNSMMADIIQYDTIKTGVNQEGIFSAARSFINQMGTSLAIMIVPSVICIGAKAGENIGRWGLRLSALIGGFICAGAVVIYFFYREKDILGTIAEHSKKEDK